MLYQNFNTITNTPVTPSALYRQYQQNFNLHDDLHQQSILAQMDEAHANIIKSLRKNPFSRWLSKKMCNPIKGFYIWGGVGRGKTMLMDIFYESLPANIPKQRVHFHRFIQHVHQELKTLKLSRDPLKIVANRISRNTRVLCLDEFHVNDIADAMLLGGLLAALFKNNLCLVTTSNRPPDDLYKNGLQRTRFLPAIALLKSCTMVLNLESPIDYRLQTLRREHTYFFPLGNDADAHLNLIFNNFTLNANQQPTAIELHGRRIHIKGEAEGAIWFEFKDLCDGPRSQEDYLEIAREHHSLFLSNIPLLNEDSENAARRFLILLDILYDHRVKLIASAEVAIQNLYTGKKLAFEFDRATSRLVEMQSDQYLSQTHLP